MKITKIQKTGKDSLYTTFLTMTLVPLLVFGIIVSVYISRRVRISAQDKTHENMRNIAVSVEAAYNMMYEGDYNVLLMKESVTLYKGDAILSERTELIDKIKAESGVDVSLFFADARLLTTLTDENGDRYINIPAADRVVSEVFIEQNEKFYDNVKIGTTPYFAFYKPLYSENGQTCLGMIGVAVPTEEVNKDVLISILQTIVILIIFMLITAFVIVRASSSVLDIISKILVFLRALTDDKLDAKIDDTVLNRKDELGEIGLASSKLQLTLKKLIERDALTTLYNRRACERKLADFEKQGIKASISIGDIDFFKKFNDSFGHECGDVVLKEVAAALNEGMRGKGFVARWGGEEFLLVFENTEEPIAGEYLNDILQSVRDRVIEYDGQTHSVTMTFGVVGRVQDETISDQIRRADDKLYEGKQGGRNRVIV